jgi:hypothetical protein
MINIKHSRVSSCLGYDFIFPPWPMKNYGVPVVGLSLHVPLLFGKYLQDATNGKS